MDVGQAVVAAAGVDQSLAPIRRTFTLDDVTSVASPLGIERTVLVQVLADATETVEFLALASGTDLVAGVVGWVAPVTEAGMRTRRICLSVGTRWLGPAGRTVHEGGATLDVPRPWHTSPSTS
jgi:hypothetical protein